MPARNVDRARFGVPISKIWEGRKLADIKRSDVRGVIESVKRRGATIYANTGDGRVIHFCGVLCMNACLAYSAALMNGRAVHPGYVPNTRQ